MIDLLFLKFLESHSLLRSGFFITLQSLKQNLLMIKKILSVFSVLICISSSSIFAQCPVASASNKSICSGNSTSITVSSTVTGTTYTWTSSSSAGITGAASSGTVVPINNTLTNSGTSSGTVTYTITPIANGCTGTPVQVIVTVNPIPDIYVNTVPVSVCYGSQVNIDLLSHNSGTTFSWTAQGPNILIDGLLIGVTKTGTQNPISIQVASNNPPAPVYISITPTLNGCSGVVKNLTPIIVQPLPSFSASNLSVCAGNPTNVSLNGLAGGTYSWTVVSQNNLTGATNGTSTGSIAQQLTLTSSTLAGTATYNVTPQANGCSGSPQNVVATVNPTPNLQASLVIDGVEDQTHILPPDANLQTCPGQVGVKLYSGVNASFSPQITMNVISQTANLSGSSLPSNVYNGSSGPPTVNLNLVNYTTTTGQVVYSASALTSTGCSSSPISIPITVQPAPVLIPASNSVCSGLGQTTIPLMNNSSSIPIVYSYWTLKTSDPLVSGATSASGNQFVQTLINSSSSASGTLVYSVIPKATNGCKGLPSDITVIVNPMPTINPMSVMACSANPSLPLNTSIPYSNVAWATKSVTAGVSGGLDSPGFDASIFSPKPTNSSTTNSGTVVYTVGIHSNQNCPSQYTDVSVRVAPNLKIYPSANDVTCSGSTSLSFATYYQGITPLPFDWNINTSANVSGATSGTNYINFDAGANEYFGTFTQNLSNTSTTSGTVDYTIKLKYTENPYPACYGDSFIKTVTVYPIPLPVISGLQSVCANQAGVIYSTNNSSGNGYTWTITGGAITSGQGTNSITVTWGSGSSGTLAVKEFFQTSQCAGQTSGFPVTINALPSITNTAAQLQPVICNGITLNFTPTSSLSSSTYSWTSSVSGSITGASPSGSGTITNTLLNNIATSGTVTYAITPSANGCIGSPVNYIVTVNATPNVLNSDKSICSGQSTNMSLTSNVAGATFSWTVVSSSGITGASSGSGTTINNTLVNTNFIGTAVYRITASLSSCAGPSKDITATINNCSNEALVFDGSNDYVSIPEKNGRLNLGTGPFTMEVFMKANSAGSLVTLLSKRTFINNVWSSFLFGIWDNGKPFIQLSNTPNILPLTSSINLLDGNCHHVAVRRSGTTISFFVDGNFISNGDSQSSRNIDSSGPVRIGNDTQSPTVINGWIGEVRVWNIALTDAQILSNMSAKLVPQTGLMALYDMKDAAGSQALTDLSTTVVATQNNGTLGSSSATDASDPTWLTGNLVTCNAGNNFRIVSLTSENSYSADSLRKEFINTDESVSLFPNPANESVTIQLLKEVQHPVPLKMFDAFGREVYSVRFQKGEKTKTVNTEAMASGAYIIQIEVYGILFKKKVMVIHR